MAIEVFLTDDALDDLQDIADYLSTTESADIASRIVGKIEEVYVRLAEFPNRGAIPHELSELGMRDFRQVFFKPYRIIYKVVEDRAVVYVIADGRRDMRTLLRRRLLR
ncbi:MAG: type II toxin-antitoxin system RelE/ParE family toxin [Gammaproteobacteria bacterium]|nr:type II toxin-antitoxin system RelE/ParE family toxin [Gammaproteobacteria bacterium]MYA16453.1 type II toxin-antitoxin system RelE/ParE family toxin [Gammaproteobacteria bacterium]